jgi:uncharacterized protein DUF6152
MRRALTTTIIAAVGLFMISFPVAAHHGAATFDTGKKLTMEATVTEWTWANPHCFLKFDVTDEGGTVRHWIAETSNPPDMINRGWARNSFKAGDRVTVIIEPVKNGRTVGRVLEVTFPNGKILSTTGGPTVPGEGARQ